MTTTKTIIQDKALETVSGYNRCSVDISMGVGKTLFALKHMDRFYDSRSDPRPMLVVTPTKSIQKGWADDARKHGLEHLLENIVFTLYRSLAKTNPDGYSIVYMDEFQNILESHLGFLNRYQGPILALSGTPPNANSMKGRIASTFFPTVYRYTIDDAVAAGLLNDYRIYVHMMELSEEKNLVIQNARGGKFRTSEKENYEYWTERIMDADPLSAHQYKVARMAQMKNYPTKVQYAKRLAERIKDKVLIFANTKEQADEICKYAYYSGNDLSEYNLQLFANGDITKMSCVLQLSEGKNIPGLKQGIIMHAYGNNHKTAQRIGRLLRLEPWDISYAHVFCFNNTIDVQWVGESLKEFNQDKIIYGNFNV